MKNEKRFLFILLVATMSVIVIACCGDLSEEGEKPAETPSAPAPVTPEKPSGGVTLANFNRVQTGMTYAEVCEIFGEPGELMSQSELMGTKSEMYSWNASKGFGNCNVMLIDDRVQSKAQFGLE